MTIRPDRAFGLLLVVLAPVAILAMRAPAVLTRHLGGPRSHGAQLPEAFLRIAGVLLLIGAAVTWYRLLKL